MTASPHIAPREYVQEFSRLLDRDADFNTLYIRQDELAASQCVRALADFDEDLEKSSRTGAGSVTLCQIDGIQIRLTANNNLHIKLPNAGRRFVYDFQFNNRVNHYEASNGNLVFFDRAFDHPLSQAVIDKLADLLARQAAVQEREIEDDLAEPPIDLLEENAEETPSALDLLR
jgi:hypothetical protein